MRKLLCAMLVLALLAVPVLAVSVTAESAVDEGIILSDLIPDKVDSNFQATDCEAVINRDGSLTVTITGANPALKIKLAEGTLLYTGADVKIDEDAYVAVDFGTAGTVVVSHMILHYTRKDKDAAGTFADLYLDSMYSNDFAQYRKQAAGSYTSGAALENGGNYHVVWDWGGYLVNYGPEKYFDDKMHKFVDIDLEFGTLGASTVGSQITFYTIAVVSEADVELGTVKPDPITPGDDPSDEPSDDPGTSDESSEDPAASDEPSEDPAVSDESSEASSTASSEATSSTATSSENTSSTATSSNGTSSTASAAESSNAEEGGSNTGLIIGIVAAVVVVAGAVVGVVVSKKKKK